MVILTTIFHLVSGKGKGEKGGFKGKGGKDYYSHKALVWARLVRGASIHGEWTDQLRIMCVRILLYILYVMYIDMYLR